MPWFDAGLENEENGLTMRLGQRPDQGHSPERKPHVTARQSRRLTSGGKAEWEIAKGSLKEFPKNEIFA
jgi:hypothetical protein